jgi:hypothetical protein
VPESFQRTNGHRPNIRVVIDDKHYAPLVMPNQDVGDFPRTLSRRLRRCAREVDGDLGPSAQLRLDPDCAAGLPSDAVHLTEA